jgi:hypothetical protein
LASNSHSFSQETGFSAKDIRAALDTLTPSLGNNLVKLITDGLATFGLDLSKDENSYSMVEIEDVLTEVFSSAAPILIARVRKALSNQRDLPT